MTSHGRFRRVRSLDYTMATPALLVPTTDDTVIWSVETDVPRVSLTRCSGTSGWRSTTCQRWASVRAANDPRSASHALLSAVEIGLFEALAHGGKSLEELRTELKISVRAANALIATLCGLKLLSAFHHFGTYPSSRSPASPSAPHGDPRAHRFLPPLPPQEQPLQLVWHLFMLIFAGTMLSPQLLITARIS